MRVVYDTNVLAIIVSRREEILRLKDASINGKFRLIVSQFILDELETVLIAKFGLTKQSAKARTRLLRRMSEIVQPANVEKVARDPDDDYILATALAGKADYIVTLDRDLLILEEYKQIKVIKPTDLER